MSFFSANPSLKLLRLLSAWKAATKKAEILQSAMDEVWYFLCWITRVHQETFSSLFFLAHPYSPAEVQVLGHQVCSGRLQLYSASIQAEAVPAFSFNI